MRRLRRSLAGLLALLVGAALPASADPDEALARLREAVARHPEDRDLSWALARTLAERGRLEAAAARLSAHLRRWPDHPPGGWLVLGRWRYELHEDAAAVEALEREIARSPGTAPAHLLLGLAKQRLGRFDEAERHFEVAATLDAALTGEALLLRGLARIERGDTSGGERLLTRLAREHPGTEEARSANLVLRGSAAPRQRGRLRLAAYSGAAYDSNVTLEGGADFPGAGDARADARFAWGASGSVRALRGERHDLEIGARYDGIAHADLREYDTQRVLGFVSGRYQPRRRLALRMDGWVGFSLLDYEPYLLEGTLRPGLLVSLGPRAGVLRLFAEGTRLAYDEQPFATSLERDGWAWGGGLEHTWPVPGLQDVPGLGRVWMAAGASYGRYDTEAGRDVLGFEGAYDHDRWRGSLRSRVPLPWRLRAEADLRFDAELYDHTNVIDALTRDGVGTTDPRERRDLVWSAGLVLVRAVTPLVDLELYWNYTNRDSNVDLYTYDRSIAGLTVRVHTP